MTRIQLRENLTGLGRSLRPGLSVEVKETGGAMRVAPLGAYFADALSRVAKEAQASSRVTHFHAEGVAGTVATALAAAIAWQWIFLPPTDRNMENR